MVDAPRARPMRDEGEDGSADASRHERALVAAARELAAHARARAAAGAPGREPGAGRFAPLAPDEQGRALDAALPGYTIEREVSRGGQGVVYQGVQRSTGRPVAIKVMREGP